LARSSAPTISAQVAAWGISRSDFRFRRLFCAAVRSRRAKALLLSAKPSTTRGQGASTPPWRTAASV
jgi:hypothetical protein